MNLKKLAPWNWFKQNEQTQQNVSAIPVRKSSFESNSHQIASTLNVDLWLNLHRQIDRLLDDTFNALAQLPMARDLWRSTAVRSDQLCFLPNLDISSDDQKYEISLDVPGVQASDLDIQVHDGVLTIVGQKTESKKETNRRYYRMERRVDSFQRTLSLPEDALEDNIKARIENGVLKLEVPRRPLADNKVKRIPILS